MDIKILQNFGLAVSLLVGATTVQGQVISDQVACPSLNAIQQHATKIDAVEKDIFGYSVHSTSNFTNGDLQWIIGVNMIMAQSSDDALIKGITIVANSKYLNNEYAYELEKGLYICNYGPFDIVAAGGHMASVL